MKLFEIGNAVRPYELTSQRDQLYLYEFDTSEGAHYQVKFDGALVDPIDLVELFPYNLEAARDKNMGAPLEKGDQWVPKLRAAQKFFPHIVSYELTFALIETDDFGDNEYEYTVTNKGGKGSLEVMATVQKIVGDFLERCEDYDVITFSAHEESRQRLYNRFADAIEQHLGFAQLRGQGYSDKEYVLIDPDALDIDDESFMSDDEEDDEFDI